MAANPLPDDLDGLLSMAEDMADGAAAHGVAIGLLQNTEARIRADITALRTRETNTAYVVRLSPLVSRPSGERPASCDTLR